jgi:DNA polymerase III subunit epsilon
MLKLNLERPLVVFDLETTGVNFQSDKIVEISVIKVMPDGTQQIKTRRINPEMPIPAEASAIHGIYDKDVENEPTFKDISKNLYLYLEDCDLSGYNLIKFDVPMLVAEFKRVGLDFEVKSRRLIDAFVIFRKMFPRSLTGAYKFFCGKELEGAHGAEADTLATLEVLAAQLDKYDELPKSMDELHDFCDETDPDAVDSTGKFKWVGENVVVNFGKNSGTALRTIAVNNPGFLRWMMRGDFAEDAKNIAQNAMSGIFPEKKSE